MLHAHVLFSAHHIPNPRSGEHEIFFLRRHAIVLLKPLLLFVLQAGVGIGLYFLLQNTVGALLDNEIAQIVLILLGSAYALLTWLLFFHGFLDYYLDTSLVTTARIINVEQHGLFARTRTEQNLHRVQDVTAEVKGMIPTLFNYGHVYVQTAGAQERTVMKQVPNPNAVAERLHELIDAERRMMQSET